MVPALFLGEISGVPCIKAHGAAGRSLKAARNAKSPAKQGFFAKNGMVGDDGLEPPTSSV
jgi:hypothetical protein